MDIHTWSNFTTKCGPLVQLKCKILKYFRNLLRTNMTRLTYQVYDATRMQNLLHKGPAQAKVAWGCSNLENSSTVWSWRIHVFTNLYPSVESNPKIEKTQRWWCESFQSQEQIHERTWHIITDWLGLETMVWILWNIYWSLSRQVTGRKPVGTYAVIHVALLSTENRAGVRHQSS